MIRIDEILGCQLGKASRIWRFRRATASQANDPIEAATMGLDGLFLAAEDLFEPLVLMVDTGWRDINCGYFPSDFSREMVWRLEARHLPEEISRIGNWEVSEGCEQVDQVDRASADVLLRRACAQDRVRPLQISSLAVRARLSESMVADLERLLSEFNLPVSSLPIERDDEGIWIAGPQREFTVPVTIELDFDRTELELRLFACWSLWREEGRPGTAAIQDAVARLEQRGWRRVE